METQSTPKQTSSSSPQKSDAKPDFIASFIHWVDLYLMAKPTTHTSMTRILTPIVLAIALGAAGAYSVQQMRGDTYKNGYQAREIEQWKNTYTDTLLRVDEVVGQRVLFQALDIHGRPYGVPFVRKVCPGLEVRWNKGEIVQRVTWEDRPQGDNGKGCENVSYPELGFGMARNADTLESINLILEGQKP